MDWVTFGVSVGVAVAGGGLLTGIVAFLMYRHQSNRETRLDIFSSYDKQIGLAEKRKDEAEVNRLTVLYAEQLEAWRAQQGVEALAPSHILPEGGTTLSKSEIEELRRLLPLTENLNPVAVTAEGHFLKGNAHYGTGEYDGAIREYTRALALKPDNLQAYNNRGLAYDNKGDHDRAIQDYDKVLALRPDYPGVYSNRGVAYRHKEDYDRAIQDFDKTINIKPNNAVAFFNRACLHSLRRDIEQTVTDLTKSRELDPSVKPDSKDEQDLDWARQDPRVRALLGMDEASEGTSP